MKYCFALAKNGKGHVKTNPLVGAIVVYGDRIIGQGYHTGFGNPHAEVEAIRSVKNSDISLLKESTLYVSLEPCNHVGKTPPCTQLILEQKIKKLVYACQDPNPKMSGNSIAFLQSHGVEIAGPILESEGKELIKEYSYSLKNQRPYLIIKFAQTADFFISKLDSPIKISQKSTDILVHKWRSESDAIAVGKQTIDVDNPLLTNRYWPGPSPIRIPLSKKNDWLPNSKIFNADAKTLRIPLEVYNENAGWSGILEYLFQQNIGNLLVEGGANVIESILHENVWSEGRIITSKNLYLKEGLKSPILSGILKNVIDLGQDKVEFIQNVR